MLKYWFINLLKFLRLQYSALIIQGIIFLMGEFPTHQNQNNICLTYQNNLMMSRVKTFLFLYFPAAMLSLEISSMCFDSFTHANLKILFCVIKKINFYKIKTFSVHKKWIKRLFCLRC